jgi:hypothetical protein
MARNPDKPPLSIVDPTSTGVAPPRSLGEHGRKLWDSVQREYGVRDCGGVEILAQICAAQDRVEALCDGETIHTRNGPRAHPALRDETQLRAFIIRAIEKLGLNIEVVKPVGRPSRPVGIGWDQV